MAHPSPLKPAPSGAAALQSAAPFWQSAWLPAVFAFVVSLLFLPIPSQLLDGLLVFNIALTCVLWYVSVEIHDPKDFSAFPSLLLYVTLFRLALNVMSTKMILLHGQDGPGAAGVLIQGLGLVFSGNSIAGFILFAIIAAINFVVITRGASRIAEVAARFTLDALPGKQMAIDADLNSKEAPITIQEANRRRAELREEVAFHGAMDGASKFVHGDAVMSVLMFLVNLLGGFGIGMLQQHLAFGQALSTYTNLSIGEALVALIPAMILSIASASLVTRSSSSGPLGASIISQLRAHAPFIGTGPVVPAAQEAPQETLAGDPRPLPDLPEAVELRLGINLVGLLKDKTAPLYQGLGRVKDAFRQEVGFPLKEIRTRDLRALLPNQYIILINGQQVATGELLPGHQLAYQDGRPAPEGISLLPTKDPSTGLPAWWVPAGSQEAILKAKRMGLDLQSHAAVLEHHLASLLPRYGSKILGWQDVYQLIEGMKQVAPALVDEVTKLAPVPLIHEVLAALLVEQVSIVNLRIILEAIGRTCQSAKTQTGQAVAEAETIVEQVRLALGASLAQPYLVPDLKANRDQPPLLRVYQVPFAVLAAIPTPQADPVRHRTDLWTFAKALVADAQTAPWENSFPVVLCVQPHRRLLLPYLPQTLPVLALEEIRSVSNVKVVREFDWAAIKKREESL